jgi:hypothetical protein
MHKTILILCAIALSPVITRAQDGQASAAPAQASQAKAELPSSLMTNVQVELTITDQTGTAAPDKKTVSMIVAHAAWGKIRTSAEAYQKSTQSKIVPVGLNVDARPFVQSGQIRLELTIVYSPMMLGTSADSAQTRPTELNQSLTVALQSGKPMVVSQAADPVTDRKIGVEVKATILK